MTQKTLTPAAYEKLQGRYEQLKQEISDLGWISQGSVMHKPPGAWRWTRKVKAKTVGVALSATEAAQYKTAITEHRKLEEILKEMREISAQILQNSDPERPGRKNPKPPLS